MTATKTLALAALTAAVAMCSTASAATHPANCGTKWIKSGTDARQDKVRVTTWVTAPDVHTNASCARLWSDVPKVVYHATLGHWGSWQFDRNVISRWGNYDQYYGGHGLWLRIRFLAERGYPNYGE